MKKCFKFLFVLLLGTLVACSPNIPQDISAEIEKLPEHLDFNIDVKPILSDKCFACHGPDQNKLEANLRLDIESSAKSNGAIVEGSLRRSESFHRIISEEKDQVMPPPKSNLELSNREKAILIKWIKDGAEYKDHWAFAKVAAVTVPSIDDESLVVNEIDHFVLDKLSNYDLSLNKEADKSLLLRRLSFDLTGLPPGIEDIEAFENDDSGDAYEKQVDKLLASKSYGERMATDWLDVARFADTHGYQSDRFRDMSPWRDWVIKTFNQNLPYDDFITWQLAGDLLEEPTREQLIATAFLRLHPQNEEGGIVEEEFRVEYVTDRVNTVGTALMGMTVGCAKCHDHKYDPISQKEYFEMFSFFDNIKEAGQISYDGAMPVPTIQLTDERTDSIVAFINQEIDSKEKIQSRTIEAGQEKFESWLAAESYTSLSKRDKPRGIRAHFDLNENLRNKVNSKEVGKMERVSSGKELPLFVPGKYKSGLKLDGDAWLNLYPVGTYDKADDFNIGIWVNIPADIKDGVIFHKGDGAALYNFKGLHLALKDNRLEILLACTVPYNAIIEYAKDDIPRDQWIHLSMNYDGKGNSEGLSAYLNGVELETVVAEDNLYKDIVINKGKDPAGIQIGARWRGKGIGGAMVDEFTVYDRSLSSLEILQLGDYNNWKNIVSKSNEQLTAQEIGLLKSYFTISVLREADPVSKELENLHREKNQLLDTIQELMVMDEMPAPRKSYILDRGQYDSPSEEVFPNTPAAILGYNTEAPKDRLGFARWLLHDEHPLTARVAVNRYWQLFFGEGLVKTTEDFGNQGSLPKNKELLDWLAQDFRSNDWDIKAIIKKIVMSATYRQSSICDKTILEMDPDNNLFARGPSGRLSAEMIRDNILVSSGLMVDTIGGPSVYPYQPEGLWSMMSGRKYKVAEGDDRYRRSMYTIWKRTVPHPTQATFDAPERSECTVRRQETNTPLQALALMNDLVYLDGAKKMAYDITQSGSINEAFTKLTGRKPVASEQKVINDMVQMEYQKFKENQNKIASWLPDLEQGEINNLDKARIASNAVVISTIMNTDATIVKR